MKRTLEVTAPEVIFASGCGAFPIKEATNDFSGTFAVLNRDSEAEIARVIDGTVSLSTNDGEAFAVSALK